MERNWKSSKSRIHHRNNIHPITEATTLTSTKFTARLYCILAGVLNMFIILCILLIYVFQQTIEFFKKRHRIELTFDDRMEFLNLWFVMIIINDVMTIVGSSLKINIENKVCAVVAQFIYNRSQNMPVYIFVIVI